MRSEWEILAKQQNHYEKKENFKDNIAFSTFYIEWLEQFTEKHKSFSTDSFIYDENSLTKEEKDNVELIEALYEIIDEYADNNYIKPKTTDFGNYYTIGYNNNSYIIGVDGGQGTSFYCERLDEYKKNSLEYKHLMGGVKLPSTLLIDQKLDELVQLIERLNREEIPLEAIHQKADTVLQKLKINRQKDY